MLFLSNFSAQLFYFAFSVHRWDNKGIEDLIPFVQNLFLALWENTQCSCHSHYIGKFSRQVSIRHLAAQYTDAGVILRLHLDSASLRLVKIRECRLPAIIRFEGDALGKHISDLSLVDDVAVPVVPYAAHHVHSGVVQY